MAGTRISRLGPGGYPRPPYGDFVHKVIPPATPPNPIGFNLRQLDYGLQFHTIPTYRGPSLGWVQTTIKPQRLVTAPDDVIIQPGDGIILINVAAAINVILPLISDWVNESVYRPYQSFDRGIWVKDLGGNAGAFPITIYPQVFGPGPAEFIDNTAPAAIVSNFGIAKIYPLFDLSNLDSGGAGWFLGN